MRTPAFGFNDTVVHDSANLTVMTNTVLNCDEELERWEKCWAMDSYGICWFSGTKDAERDAVNKKVLEFFNQTIQHRSDGYYVRLPYKDDHDPLSSNKAIALRRLHSVLDTLKSSPNLLTGYQEIMAEQADKGISEKIRNGQPLHGVTLHYIPHQPVITPRKDTTKLRMVFDASSHFKDCPPLNDILHQGPLLLPKSTPCFYVFASDHR